MTVPEDSPRARSWTDPEEPWDSLLVLQLTSVRSASAQVKLVATPNPPVAVSLPGRPAGWCRCSTQLAAVTLAEVAELGSRDPYMFETDQVPPLPPPPIHIRVSTCEKGKA